MSVYSVDKLIAEARRLAREYREATGKTLPITGEIAINDAIRILDLKETSKEEVGIDATMNYRGGEIKLQIKGRAIFDSKRSGYRLGQVKLEQDWDALLLVLMNEAFDTTELYLATRDVIEEALDGGSNKRGSITVARFRNIGELLWSQANGFEDDETKHHSE